MAGKLIMRVEQDDQLEPVSIYLRPGGTYQYVEEQFSEWDNSQASWVKRQPSGIFRVPWTRGKRPSWQQNGCDVQMERGTGTREGAPPKNWRCPTCASDAFAPRKSRNFRTTEIGRGDAGLRLARPGRRP